jgi:hypothetical protein
MFKNRSQDAKHKIDSLTAVARRDDVRKDAIKVWSDIRSLFGDVSKARRRKTRVRAFAGAAAVASVAGAAAWIWRGRHDEASMGLASDSTGQFDYATR